MRSSMRFILAGSLVAVGFLLGSAQVFRPLQAQPDASAPSDDAVKKIREAYGSLKGAAAQLTLESRYTSITKDVNAYSVLVGGINVKDDLESGHGVDPDTFAALNLAVYEMKKNNAKDDSLADWVDINLFGYDNGGHLTYRNKVVRIYSISRMRRLNAQRLVILEEGKELKPAK